MTDLEKQLAASLHTSRADRDMLVRAQVRVQDAIAGMTSATHEIGAALGPNRPSYDKASHATLLLRQVAALLDIDLKRMK